MLLFFKSCREEGKSLDRESLKKGGENKAKTPLLKRVVKETRSVGECHLSVYWSGQPVSILNLDPRELNRSEFLFCFI